MSGYPCCCRKRPSCGECHGTAATRYQLTAPPGTFINNPLASPQGCGDACAEYSGAFLLDHATGLIPYTSSDVTCIWHSPEFELCYGCHLEFDEVTITCVDLTWRWRMEISDQLADDGYIGVFVFLINTAFGFIYTWSGHFHEDCSAPLELHWDPTALNEPAPGCVNDPEAVLLLEAL